MAGGFRGYDEPSGPAPSSAPSALASYRARVERVAAAVERDRWSMGAGVYADMVTRLAMARVQLALATTTPAQAEAIVAALESRVDAGPTSGGGPPKPKAPTPAPPPVPPAPTTAPPLTTTTTDGPPIGLIIAAAAVALFVLTR